MRSVKDSVLELVRRLPDQCTWDDVMYEIYVRQKIESGIEDAENGRTVPHDEVFAEFNK